MAYINSQVSLVHYFIIHFHFNFLKVHAEIIKYKLKFKLQMKFIDSISGKNFSFVQVTALKYLTACTSLPGY
jgi:hypothetical protein